MNIQTLEQKVNTQTYLSLPLKNWRTILAKEVQVYVCDGAYLAKAFNEINYRFCSVEEAKAIVIDNLYALLRFKYFPDETEEVAQKIQQIVSSFTTNLKSTLITVSFDKTSRGRHMSYLPDYCIAFANGVYNFKDDCWLFKYDIIDMTYLSNQIYSYDRQYAIMWYMNYEFEPLPFNIMDNSYEEIITLFKKLVESQPNYCFELCYNIAHNATHSFDIKRFQHLCEVLGYVCLQSFAQYFVMLIGSGQNGKNSLFDGCFTNRLVPKPASNDLDSIENDRFITGSLENHAHNIFLETSAKVYKESRMLKALTGSMYQTIESKGVSKYSGIINCKYIFAGNDKDEIKFTDTTIGFRRRINLFEIFYRWDKKKEFLKQGDYYDTTFSNSLKELTEDVGNNTLFIYLAMMGIKSATKNFTSNFEFSRNDWSSQYENINNELRAMISKLTCFDYSRALKTIYNTSENIALTAIFNENRKRIYSSFTDFSEMLDYFEEPQNVITFFNNQGELYVSSKFLYAICHPLLSSSAFTKALKKLSKEGDFSFNYMNIPYLKVIVSNTCTKIL